MAEKDWTKSPLEDPVIGPILRKPASERTSIEWYELSSDPRLEPNYAINERLMMSLNRLSSVLERIEDRLGKQGG